MNVGHTPSPQGLGSLSTTPGSQSAWRDTGHQVFAVCPRVQGESAGMPRFVLSLSWKHVALSRADPVHQSIWPGGRGTCNPEQVPVHVTGGYNTPVCRRGHLLCTSLPLLWEAAVWEPGDQCSHLGTGQGGSRGTCMLRALGPTQPRQGRKQGWLAVSCSQACMGQAAVQAADMSSGAGCKRLEGPGRRGLGQGLQASLPAGVTTHMGLLLISDLAG